MKLRALPLYAAAHLWVDLACALLVLGRLEGGGDAVTALLLYNCFAFAVQMPVGLLADTLGGGERFATLGCGLTAMAWVLPGLIPAAVCAGLGNACFHVGGGLYTLNGSEKCGPLGLFVSPGALGVALGTLLAAGDTLPAPVVVLPLLGLGAALLRWGRGAPNSPLDLAPEGGTEALLPLLCLFAVVVLRSFAGTLFDFPWKGELPLVLACATAGGKAAGGLLADRLGSRRTAWLSLVPAAVCFLLAGRAGPGLAAVCLFNMTMPLTLWGAARRLPGARGFAFGLLTFALFLGVVPSLLGYVLLPGGPLSAALAAACSLPLLLLGLRRGEGRC